MHALTDDSHSLDLCEMVGLWGTDQMHGGRGVTRIKIVMTDD